jgi:putative ABC transport system ATP-binding protein
VAAGEVVAVTGPSGSGKSTLLACLAGLDEPDGGVVQVRGQRLSRRSEEVRAGVRARHVGMLFQQANLVGHLSVAENITLVQRLAGGRARMRSRAELLERCGIRRADR